MYHFLLLLLLVLFLCRFGVVVAQPITPVEEKRPRYGLYGDLNINLHTAEFRALPGYPNCCQLFESGTGLGFAVGFLYELPFSSGFSASLRAGYSLDGATLSAKEGTTVIIDGAGTPATFEHLLSSSISSIGLEPLIGIELFGGVTFHTGLRAALVLQKSFDQKEQLLEPVDRGTFENDQRTRNVYAGDIPNAHGFMASWQFGLSRDLPLNREGTLLLSPEIFFSLGLTPVMKDSTWRINALRIGTSIKYSPKPDPVIAVIAAPPPPPVTTAVLPLLSATVSAVGVESDGHEVPLVRLRVEEFISVSMRPLLNYLFFDEGSSALASRYSVLSAADANSFRVENLHDVPTLPTYYNLLNIIGRRLNEHPSSTVTLVGCNSDLGEEQGNLDLSRRRAETVRNYLRDVWIIPEARIRIDARNLPAKPSNSAEEDGVVENRRVEIYSDTWEVVEPVVTDDTLRRANPPIIRFRPAVTSEAGVAQWRLIAQQNGVLLKEISGSGALPQNLEWQADREGGTIPHAPNPIEYSLEVRDVAGQQRSTPLGTLPVEQVTIQKKRSERIADREIDRYSLILFDFDKSDFTDANQRIADFIKGRIRLDATVTIEGSTDRTGELDHNLRLSEARARTTAKALGVVGEGVRGLGEQPDLHDNDLPEGRFYSRTVNIVVETPVK